MVLRRVGVLFVLAGALALVLVGCGESSGSPAAGKTTIVVTVAPSSSSPSSSPASSAPAPGTTTAAPSPTQGNASSSPADVVEAYFAAINAQDYAKAWSLGGKNLGGSYSEFAAGFADTLSDNVSVLSTSGSTVTVDLVATQSDGTQKHFTGSYKVSGGAITSASITQVGGGGGGNGDLCGAPANPYGYNFCERGHLIYDYASGTCSYFHCIDYFDEGRGYMVQCNDGQYSMSGGIEDACSYHEGVSQPVYSGP